MDRNRKTLEQSHVAKRARQRYGIVLTDEILDDWARQIRDKKATLVAGLDDSMKVYDVAHEGRPVRVLYCYRDGKFVTALPRTRRQMTGRRGR